jgi:hypothetical protein
VVLIPRFAITGESRHESGHRVNSENVGLRPTITGVIKTGRPRVQDSFNKRLHYYKDKALCLNNKKARLSAHRTQPTI